MKTIHISLFENKVFHGRLDAKTTETFAKYYVAMRVNSSNKAYSTETSLNLVCNLTDVEPTVFRG